MGCRVPAPVAGRQPRRIGPIVAAWLARRVTTATLAELAGQFGLSHSGSVPNPIRAIEKNRALSATLRRELEELEAPLATPHSPAPTPEKTKTRPAPNSAP
jgi:hypothetical protein